MLNEQINNDDVKRQHHIDSKSHKRINKNTPKNIDLDLTSYQYFEGVNLLAIEGFSHSTILSIMSEIGLEGIKKAGFTETQIVKALHEEQSGGKTE